MQDVLVKLVSSGKQERCCGGSFVPLDFAHNDVAMTTTIVMMLNTATTTIITMTTTIMC